MESVTELISGNSTPACHHPLWCFLLRLWELLQRHLGDTGKTMTKALQPSALPLPDWTDRLLHSTLVSGCKLTLFYFFKVLWLQFLLEILIEKKFQVPCHTLESFGLVCKDLMCLRCSSWSAWNPAWASMGTIWKGSCFLWQCGTADCITEWITEADTIKGSFCNQVLHTHSLLKGLW